MFSIVQLSIRQRASTALRRLIPVVLAAALSPGSQAQQMNTDSLRHIVQTATDPKIRLKAVTLVLKTLFNSQQYDSVEIYGRRFLPEAEKYGYSPLICQIHFHRADKYNRNGKLDSALLELNIGERMATLAKDSSSLFQVLDYMGLTYSQQNNTEALRNLYYHSLPLAVHPKAGILLVRMATNYALALQDGQQTDSALYILRRAEEMARPLPKDVYYYVVYSLGGALLRAGQWQEAEKLLNESLAFFTGQRMYKAVAAVQADLAGVLFRKKQYSAALNLSNPALAYGLANNDYDILKKLYPLSANIYKSMGQWEKAYDFLTKADLLKDSLSADKNKTAVAGLKLQYESALKEKENQVLALQLEKRKNIITRQRWIMGLGAALVVLTGLSYALYLRNRRRRLVQEAELKQVDSELRSLKSQLDPHFIHNFFDFLSRQVREGQRENSVDLLDECSRYFRTILEQNREHIITLEEEMEGLTRYLHIQQRIQEDKFDFKIEADENVDLFGIELPAFLFQPFIENSIKHGFSDIDYKGQLKVHFSATGDYLEGTITDNGSGPATEPKNKGAHKSVGMELTGERLSLFAKLKRRGQGLIESGLRTDGKGYFVRVKIPLA